MFQKKCDSRRLSLSRNAIASDGVTDCLTADGLHETRTNPASVSGQVDQPLMRASENHDCTAW